MKIRLFISHSHSDKGLAKAVTSLVQYGCNLAAEHIRCTSVDGFRLQSGVNIDAQLREELRDADYVIGILSDISIDSFYVLAELGARWGHSKPMATLKASTLPLDKFSGPLSNLALTPLDTAPQVNQIVREAQKILGISSTIDPNKLNGYVAQVIDQNRKLGGRPTSLQITKAMWGTADKSVDVTQRLSALVRNDRLAVYAGNDIAWTDPAYGLRKQLKIEAVVHGKPMSKTVDEGVFLELP